MTLEAQALICPSCGSENLVEENAGRYLCLDCNSLSLPDASDQRLVVGQRLCPGCGAGNADTATHCAACGAELNPHCLKCGAQMAVWHASCPRCGTDQAAYREQLAAQEWERQRQLAEQPRTTRQRGQPSRHRPRRGSRRSMWRIVWMIWPLLWAVNALGHTVREGSATLPTGGFDLTIPSQFSGQTLPFVVGACIFSVGVIVLLVSAVPSIFRSD